MAEGPVAKATLGRLTGDVKTDLSAVRKEVKLIEAAIAKTARDGGKVDAAQAARLKRAQEIGRQLQQTQTLMARTKTEERFGKLFAAQALGGTASRLISGQGNVRDVAQLLGSDAVRGAVEKALTKIGLRGVGAALNMAGPALGIGADIGQGVVDRMIGKYDRQKDLAEKQLDFFEAADALRLDPELRKRTKDRVKAQLLDAIPNARGEIRDTYFSKEVQDKAAAKSLESLKGLSKARDPKYFSQLMGGDVQSGEDYLSKKGMDDATIGDRRKALDAAILDVMDTETGRNTLRRILADEKETARRKGDEEDRLTEQQLATKKYKETMKERVLERLTANRDKRFAVNDAIFHIGD